ncbi:MAG: folate-binding protein [Paracoccaceae bacterium]
MTATWFQDKSRALLRIAGDDAHDFLQDLVTNDLDRLTDENLVYAALLTPQGKYLFDFFVGKEPDGALFIDVAANRAAALAQRLSMYRLRRKVEISARDSAITLCWGGERPEGSRPDPRHPDLGWRLYAAAPPQGAVLASRAEIDARRVALLVPETGIELIPDESYILEAGFERLHGVDFRKGCYVGQEVTARMKHKTELKKGLARVAIDGAASPGAPIEAEGKPAGVLHTVAGPEALAHLRFDRAGGQMRAGEATLRRLG